MSLKKNEEISLNITGVTGEGNGVGRYDGMAVFVPFTAVGDTIVCRIQKVEKRFAFGRMVEMIIPSEHRCDQRACDVYGKCGGCVWRHISYEAEKTYKWQKVKDAIQRIGGLCLEPQPIIGAENIDRYRNKAQYPVGLKDGEIVAGFYAPRSHRVVGHSDCALQPAFFNNIVRETVEWMREHHVSPYDETTRKGLVRHIYIRYGKGTGEVMVCLVATSGKIPGADELVRRLKTVVDGLKTVVVNINREDTNVILGDTEFVLYGDGYITDVLCGLKFKLSPRSFYQVNREQTEKLYRLAASEAALNGEETVLDLYCGTGTIGLTMAHKAKALIGVDIVAPAIEDAKENAVRNGVKNARFICADAAKAAAQLEQDGVKPDVIVIDPPRKGCDESLIGTIVKMAPEKVVYVSCDPATLARDLKRFSEQGYETMRVTPVDLFPGTIHVESVALLRRKIDVHKMKLNAIPFEMIKSGEKTIELRLFDEKRQKIRVGDMIVFTNTSDGETLNKTVIEMHRFDTFEELYQSLPLLQCGYTKEDIHTATPADMEQYYSVEEQSKYGVVGIELSRFE